MKKTFISLCLLYAIAPIEAFAHQKSGFFIEGGFETGLLQGTENKEIPIKKVHNTYEDYFPTSTIARNSSNLFTDSQEISKLKFSTSRPIKVTLDNHKKQVVVENYLPYNLNNVRLSFKDALGNLVSLGILETIPKHAKILLDQSYFQNISLINPNASYLDFQATSTQKSDTSTQNLLEKLQNTTTNLEVSYVNQPTDFQSEFCKDKNCSFTPFTETTAKEFTNLLLNLASVIDSKSWHDNIINAPFDFSDKAMPDRNGKVPTGSKTISPQDIIEKLRKDMGLDISVLTSNSGFSHWAGAKAIAQAGSPPNANAKMAVNEKGINPNTFVDRNNKSNNRNKKPEPHSPNAYSLSLGISPLLKAYATAKGYANGGNMADQHVPSPYQPKNNTTLRSDGIPYDVCSSHKDNFPKFTNSVYPTCSNVPAGFVGITYEVWKQLINQDKLPINFLDLNNQKNYLNPLEFPNTLFGAVKESLLISSATTSGVSSVLQKFKAPILGANAKIGYQHYFNNLIGLSFYGVAKYNYSKINAKEVQQIGYGGGLDVLLDFVTTYAKSKNSSKKRFASSFGVFFGARGIYSNYSPSKTFKKPLKNTLNVHAVGGFSYRYKHSKYSVGVSVPLLRNRISLSYNDSHLVFLEDPNHFNVFFNYGWVF
ncbi:porin family protein [Helicobacter cetorum]|uniref:Outer membrane protein n=1 Tax=Helicobacter cetorum (strain ATCC BAA-540 / CCUG 52418 / MIT 99-5656) TaxID=1163745 RepID=I0EQI2_HELCM|nr:hypothetical protein [Helicobacter cetorum]AFI05201.1 hypothetical protein HCD_00845 [Helicobacter cetorum MIT 99-5656]